MIDSDEKFHENKKAKRIRRTNRAIARQTRILKDRGLSYQLEYKQPHRFAKMHALDCGIPGCPMCANPRRVWGQKTIQERKFETRED